MTWEEESDRQSPPHELWTLWKDGAAWSAELRDHGQFGIDAQIFQQGDFLIRRRFDTRYAAVEWAEGATVRDRARPQSD
jgi:hypothetical protein